MCLNLALLVPQKAYVETICFFILCSTPKSFSKIEIPSKKGKLDFVVSSFERNDLKFFTIQVKASRKFSFSPLAICWVTFLLQGKITAIRVIEINIRYELLKDEKCFESMLAEESLSRVTLKSWWNSSQHIMVPEY